MKVLKVNSIDFDKPIKLKGWQDDKPLGELPICWGLLVMGRSRRWDTEHTTSNIRVLAEDDREVLNGLWKMELPEDYPIVFSQ
jgi:hypothetical protein